MEPDPLTGKRRTRRQDFSTNEAHVALAGWRIQQQGLLVECSTQTVGEMMTYWLETYASTKRPRTYAIYQDEVRRYILPYAINSLSVQDLRARHVLAWHTALRQHRARQNARHLALGPVWQDQDLVFCSDIGTPINSSNLYRGYHKLVQTAGVLYITVHDQRHTVSTWAVAAGVDLKSLSEVFGREDVQTTLNRYPHASKRRREALQTIDDILTSAHPEDAKRTL